MFKVGDLVRRKKEYIGDAPEARAVWAHGDETCLVVEVRPPDRIGDITLIRVDIDDAFKVARRFESAEPLPLWRDRLFADLRAAGASHAAATEFVAQAPSYGQIAYEYRICEHWVVDYLCDWAATSQGWAYWWAVHAAHMRNCGDEP